MPICACVACFTWYQNPKGPRLGTVSSSKEKAKANIKYFRLHILSKFKSRFYDYFVIIFTLSCSRAKR